MQLTHYTDFSLRVLIHLGLQEGPEPVTVSDIAEHFGIARNHLVKVANRLGQLGYIETIRGKGGGLRLARAPEQIVIGRVVRDMEPNMQIIDCSKPACPLMSGCQLKDILDDAMDAFVQVLDGHTLADLLTEPQGLKQMLKLTSTNA